MSEDAKSAAKPQDEKKAARSSKKSLALGLLLGLATFAIAIGLGMTNYVEQTELLSVDLRYRIRPRIDFRRDLGYIDYDDESLELFGAWPWPRVRQVALVNTVAFYKGKSAGYDVFYTEHGNEVFRPERLERALERVGMHSTPSVAGSPAEAPPPPILAEAQSEMLQQEVLGSFQDYDGGFGDALTDAGNIFLAQIMEVFEANSPTVSKGPEAIRAFVMERRKGFSEDKLESVELAARFAQPAVPGLPEAGDIVPVLPNLASSSAGVGYAQIVKDMDHTVRLYPLFINYNDSAYPSIAAIMLAHQMKIPVGSIRVEPGMRVVFPDAVIPPVNSPLDFEPASAGKSGPPRRTLSIPVDEKGQMLVNWAGAFYDHGLHVSFRHLSYYYATNLAKRIARSFAAEPGNYDHIREEILVALNGEELATRSEAEWLASRVTVAHMVEPLIRGGASADEAWSTFRASAEEARGTALDDDLAEAAKVVAAAVAVEAGETPAGAGLDEAWLAEIGRNVAFFRADDRLDMVKPFFFTRPVKAYWNGEFVDFSPTHLENMTFMVGLTGVGTIDLNPMPFEKACPMVALHCNALNTILTEQFIEFPSSLEKYGFVLLLALLGGLCCAFFTPARALLGCMAVAGLYTGYVYWAWIGYWPMEHSGQWLRWTEPMIAVSSGYLIKIVVEFVNAARERQKIRGIFSTMVSPSVLKLMEENPDKFSLTGERKNSTIFFSLIDGFGRVTAGVAPDELGSILALYLTPTSEIIMDYDGYIDKYEGHVIMADFGVPLDDPDHPWKCCFAAIEQQQDIAAFEKFVAARYGENVKVRMGINTGYVSAGNMGSEQKMQYTVMGDAVNTAARFMPANMIYNTGIITGEGSVPLIEDKVELRELDLLLLKGKTKPTAISEVMGWKKDAYLAAKTGRPVPHSLLVRWTRCPPEKVFGYAEFWASRHRVFGHSMAREIADFFESNYTLAETIMKLGAELAMTKIDGEIRSIRDTLTRVGIAVDAAPPLQGDCEPWMGRLLAWKADVEACMVVINREIEAAARPVEVLSTVSALRLQATTVFAKIATLIGNLPKKSRVGLEAVDNTLQRIRDWLAGSDITENPVESIAARQEEFRDHVAGFYKAIAARPEEYHELMAQVGSLSDDQLKLRELFVEALHLHRARKWDESLSALRRAREIVPGDGPVNSFIERIENYKISPPPPTWQGEFVQTKK